MPGGASGSRAGSRLPLVARATWTVGPVMTVPGVVVIATPNTEPVDWPPLTSTFAR